eukprot:Nk52_evm5s913 gene=Nk52_evmTU5s913
MSAPFVPSWGMIQEVLDVCPDANTEDVKRDLKMTKSSMVTVNRIFDGLFLTPYGTAAGIGEAAGRRNQDYENEDPEVEALSAFLPLADEGEEIDYDQERERERKRGEEVEEDVVHIIESSEEEAGGYPFEQRRVTATRTSSGASRRDNPSTDRRNSRREDRNSEDEVFEANMNYFLNDDYGNEVGAQLGGLSGNGVEGGREEEEAEEEERYREREGGGRAEEVQETHRNDYDATRTVRDYDREDFSTAGVYMSAGFDDEGGFGGDDNYTGFGGDDYNDYDYGTYDYSNSNDDKGDTSYSATGMENAGKDGGGSDVVLCSSPKGKEVTSERNAEVDVYDLTQEYDDDDEVSQVKEASSCSYSNSIDIGNPSGIGESYAFDDDDDYDLPQLPRFSNGSSMFSSSTSISTSHVSDYSYATTTTSNGKSGSSYTRSSSSVSGTGAGPSSETVQKKKGRSKSKKTNDEDDPLAGFTAEERNRLKRLEKEWEKKKREEEREQKKKEKEREKEEKKILAAAEKRNKAIEKRSMQKKSEVDMNALCSVYFFSSFFERLNIRVDFQEGIVEILKNMLFLVTIVDEKGVIPNRVLEVVDKKLLEQFSELSFVAFRLKHVDHVHNENAHSYDQNQGSSNRIQASLDKYQEVVTYEDGGFILAFITAEDFVYMYANSDWMGYFAKLKKSVGDRKVVLFIFQFEKLIGQQQTCKNRSYREQILMKTGQESSSSTTGRKKTKGDKQTRLNARLDLVNVNFMQLKYDLVKLKFDLGIQVFKPECIPSVYDMIRQMCRAVASKPYNVEESITSFTGDLGGVRKSKHRSTIVYNQVRCFRGVSEFMADAISTESTSGSQSQQGNA